MSMIKQKTGKEAMARIKEYVLDFTPIRWKHPGKNNKHFYDQQSHDKLATGLFLVRQHGDEPKFMSSVHVDLTFHMPIPKLKKDREPNVWYSKRPDIDNLQKFIFDAITQTDVIWKDDCIVCSLSCRKIYDKKPRTHIVIKELE